MDLESLIHTRTNNIEKEIAERIQVEEALRESEEDYKLLIKNLPGVVYRGYRDWSVRFLDSTIKELTGYDFKEFNSRKMKWSDVIVEEDLKTVSESFRKALKTGKSYVREYRIKTKDGSTRWIQDRGQIVHNNGGELESVSGVFLTSPNASRLKKNGVFWLPPLSRPLKVLLYQPGPERFNM